MEKYLSGTINYFYPQAPLQWPNSGPGLEKLRPQTSSAPKQEKVYILSPVVEIYGIEIKS